MTEKFRIQVPSDGIGGVIARSALPAMRLSAEEVRKAVADLTAALVRIEPPQQDPAPTEEQAVAMVQTIIRKLQRIANAVNYSVSVAFQPCRPTIPDPKISRRQNADCSSSEKAIINLALDLSSNPRPLSLQPCLPGRSVQWISAKLHQEMRARAQSTAPPSAGAGEDAGRVSQAVPTRPPDSVSVALGNDEGRPASALQQENDRLRAQIAAKDDQLIAKDELIDRLRRAQNTTAVAQARSWGLTQGATPMPDTGPIRLPTEAEKMGGR